MKQLIIGKKKAYSTAGTYNNLTTVEDGAIALFLLADGTLVTTNAGLTGNFCVAKGNGNNTLPTLFTEVDLKSLTVTKAAYEAATTFSGKITVPTPTIGKDYTVIITKTGTVFNERANWTFTTRAKSAVAADVAKDLVNQMNANGHTLGISATYTGGAITITAKNAGDNYVILGADELLGVAPTNLVTGKLAILDKAYVQDLASRCAADKGFNDTYADGDSIYPGYPTTVEDEQYVMYTLRFAVPRVAAKQRDEVAYQTLHICVPVGAGAITTMDAIFFPTPSED